jgi:hypothetical protein
MTLSTVTIPLLDHCDPLSLMVIPVLVVLAIVVLDILASLLGSQQ